MLLALLGVLVTLGVSLSSGGRPARWIEFVVVVCNDDWASKGTNLSECVAAGFDMLMIQEGKAADYRALLPIRQYAVRQDRSTPARAGSVLIWPHGSWSSHAAGYTFGVKARGILARWINWSRGVPAKAPTRRMWVASAHWPPHRTRAWQPAFSAALWARLRLALLAGRLILIGTDSNQAGGPPNLPTSLRWASAAPDSIDGLIHSDAIDVVSAVELPRDTSDHHPQRFVLRIPA